MGVDGVERGSCGADRVGGSSSVLYNGDFATGDPVALVPLVPIPGAVTRLIEYQIPSGRILIWWVDEPGADSTAFGEQVLEWIGD